MIGKLETVELRELWRHEARDFTSWLAENCDVLADQIGLELTVVEQEKSVGPFNVDIFAKDSDGRPVIIENQLERTNHDHLGKVLTYLSNLDAKIAIWISSDPRPEHVTAIDFLNENMPSDTQFYLIKVQALRIGDSDPAPLFTVEAGPSEERSAGGEIKKGLADSDKLRFEFFTQLLELCRQRTGLFSNVSPVQKLSWVNAGAGKSGLLWTLAVTAKAARVELVLCLPTAETNRKRFEALRARKQEIETAFGEPLFWDFEESRKQQYLRYHCRVGGLEDEGDWKAIQNDMVERLIRLELSLRAPLKMLE
jgi:hypothetical protein